jgi:hypothetical protein
MPLWHIFVLAQVRLGLNITYDRLHHMANSDTLLRQVLGIHFHDSWKTPIQIEYQNLIDNLPLLDENTLREINKVIVDMGNTV